MTITDLASRYLVHVQSLEHERTQAVKDEFTKVFQEYGLPWRIRSDNGPPFASVGIGRLSELSVWWIKLGITPELIVPGHPGQNGSHERMHRTLKAEEVDTGLAEIEIQQKAFDEFRAYFNQERPHEAIEFKTPESVYSPSDRPFPGKLSDPEYPDDFEVKRVTKDSALCILSSLIRMPAMLKHEAVGLEPIDEGKYQLWFGPVYLGLLTNHGKGVVELTKNQLAQ